MKNTEHTRHIRDFLAGFCDLRGVGDEDDLFSKKILNSLYAMQLVLFVEQSFAISVQDHELDLANFGSISAISRFVEQKTEAPLQNN